MPRTRHDSIRTLPLALGALLAAGLLAPRAARAQEFVRGDLNQDNVVSVGDAHRILTFLFLGQAPGGCVNAADVDDDGKVNLTDGVRVLNYFALGGALPAAPFPAAGPDPNANPDTFPGCESYAPTSRLEDPAARLEVLDAVIPGGAEATGAITIRISSGGELGGYGGRILVDGSAIGVVTGKPTDLTGTLDRGFIGAQVSSGVLTFGYLPTLIKPGPWVPSGDDVDGMQIPICLRPGTPAGAYELSLEFGELVEPLSGRSISPTLVSGTLVVEADVSADAGCESDEPPPPCPAPEPPTPERLANIAATFSVGGGMALPGSSVTLPFTIRCNEEVQGYSFSIDFDEEVLAPVSVVQVFHGEDPPDGFRKLEFNGRNDTPGSGGVDEGFFVGAMVFSFRDNCHNMPANTDNVALNLVLDVRPDAAVQSTEVRFLDGGQGSGQPVRNTMTSFGTTVFPELAGSFVFINGLVNIVPDITTFIRGDSNGDAKVDIADAQTTLGYLFLGDDPPRCFDAADADDSGRLLISDPIRVLTFLFIGEAAIPPPYPGEGEDPTEDSMTCGTRG